MSAFLAGGKLIALNKNKEGCPPDVRPIAVGERLCRLTGQCICATKGQDLFILSASSIWGCLHTGGAEKIVHSLRRCKE